MKKQNAPFGKLSKWNFWKGLLVAFSSGSIGVIYETLTNLQDLSKINYNLALSPTTGALVVDGGIGANHIQTYNTTGLWYGLVGGSNKGNGDKVVIGTLGNLATIGAHNGALNAWAHLSINQGGGNVSIGYATDQGYKLAVNGIIKGDNYIGKSNGFYTVQITQAAYTALGTKDASTIYMIVG